MILLKRWVLTWNACAWKQRQALYLSVNAVFYVCTAYVAVETEKKSQIAFTAVVFLFSLLQSRAEHTQNERTAWLHKKITTTPDPQVHFMCSCVFEGASEYSKTSGLCSSTHSTFELVNNTRLRSSTQHMLLPRFRMTAGGLLGVSETKGRLPSLCIHCLIYSCYRWIRCAAGDTCVSVWAQPALRAHGGRQTQDNRL